MIEGNITDFSEFNEDCYAECEDHVTIIRRNLLELEKFGESNRIDPKLLEELFRSFHTLKGLLGMIGQRDAEKLAHVYENLLKALSQNALDLSEPVINVMFEGVKGLESVIESLKSNQGLPDLHLITQKFNSFEIPLKNGSNGGDKDSFPVVEPGENVKSERLEGASTNEKSLMQYTLTYSPTSELFNAGVNVNTIRIQIEKIGEIKRSDPIVLDAGKVAFEFLVSSNLSKSEIEEILDASVKIDEIHERIVPDKIFRNTISDNTGVSKLADRPFSLTNTVRVDLNRLDDIMKMVGDLVVSRSRFEDLVKKVESKMPVQESRLLQETVLVFERQLRVLREGVMRIRLIPVNDIFERMQFVIRDMIKESQKDINLILSGKETEIDKVVVEKMLDPLLHLVRNAVSHGIETPAERVEKGKTPKGQVNLRAYTSGDSVIIEVQDDGNGIDKQKVLSEAIDRGLIAPQQELSDSELLDLICSQGFSTRKEADMNSGRGVGMAVVKNTIQELGGFIELNTEKSVGTKFTLHLPLTLAIIDALILTVSGQKFAVPQPIITEVLKIDSQSITKLENNELIPYRNGVLPILRLSSYFNLPDSSSGNNHVLVVGSGSKVMGLMADKVLSLREIVVRSIPDQLIHLDGISGATELGDSRAILILDPVSIIRSNNLKKTNITKDYKQDIQITNREVKL